MDAASYAIKAVTASPESAADFMALRARLSSSIIVAEQLGVATLRTCSLFWDTLGVKIDLCKEAGCDVRAVGPERARRRCDRGNMPRRLPLPLLSLQELVFAWRLINHVRHPCVPVTISGSPFSQHDRIAHHPASICDLLRCQREYLHATVCIESYASYSLSR